MSTLINNILITNGHCVMAEDFTSYYEFLKYELEIYVEITFPPAVSHHFAGTAYQEARRQNLR